VSEQEDPRLTPWHSFLLPPNSNDEARRVALHRNPARKRGEHDARDGDVRIPEDGGIAILAHAVATGGFQMLELSAAS